MKKWGADTNARLVQDTHAHTYARTHTRTLIHTHTHNARTHLSYYPAVLLMYPPCLTHPQILKCIAEY